MIDRIHLSVPCPKINANLGPVHFHSSDRYVCSNQSKRFGHVGIRHQRGRSGTLLLVDASLPKLLMGSNIGLLNLGEVREALSALRHTAGRHVGVSDLPPLGEWRVREVELCWAWRLEAPRAMAGLLDRQITSRNIKSFHDGTAGGVSVYWGPEEAKCRLYTKGHEVRKKLKRDHLRREEGWPTLEALREEADGILRFEQCLQGRLLKRWLGEDTSAGTLLDTLDREGLAKLRECWENATGRIDAGDYEEALVALRAAYPPGKATRLIEQWLHLREVGPSRYCAVTGTHRTTLARTLKALENAGVGLGTAETVKPPTFPADAGQGAVKLCRIRGLKHGRLMTDTYLETPYGCILRDWD